MKKRALDHDNQCEFGCAAIDGYCIPDVQIADDEPASEDAQGLTPAWYKKNQTDIWILQDVKKGVDATIARTVGDHHGCIIEDMNEARGISFGGEIDRAMCSRGTDDDKRRAGDELTTLAIQL